MGPLPGRHDHEGFLKMVWQENVVWAIFLTAIWLHARRARLGLLHPGVIFSLVWGAMFFLLSLGILRYPPLGDSAWLSCGIMYVFFLFGLTVGRKWCGLYSAHRATWVKERDISRHRFKKILRAALVLALIALVINSVIISGTIGLTSFFADGEAPIIRSMALREGLYPEWFGALNSANRYFPVLAVLYLALVDSRSKWWVPAIVCGVFSALLSTGRSAFLFTGLWVAFAYFLTIKVPTITIRKGLLVVSMTVAIFIAYGSFIGKTGERLTYHTTMQWRGITDSHPTLLSFYNYATGSIVAYDHSVTRHTASIDERRAILRIPLQVGSLIGFDVNVPSRAAEFTFIPMAFNTYTIMAPLYRAGGYWGIGLGLMVIGLVGGFLFEAVSRRRTFLTTYLYSLYLVCLVLSIFADYFITAGGVWACVAVGIGAHVYSTRKNTLRTIKHPSSRKAGTLEDFNRKLPAH